MNIPLTISSRSIPISVHYRQIVVLSLGSPLLISHSQTSHVLPRFIIIH